MENDKQVNLLERLRARQWRLTAQRRAVAEALSGRHLHLTADEVFEKKMIDLALPSLPFLEEFWKKL